MKLSKDPNKNKRLLLIVGILTVANLSVMATFPKLHLSANKKVKANQHFKQAQKIAKQILLPQLQTKLNSQYEFRFDQTKQAQRSGYFLGTLKAKNKNTAPQNLPFKIFPKSQAIFILDDQSKKYISLKKWLKSHN